MSLNEFKILIVDDIKENIYSLKLMIEDRFDNVKIYSSLNADQAINTLLSDNDTIDLILLDVQMPEINGFELAEHLKDIEKTKNIPIIFITGIYDDSKYQKQGFDLGAVEYITKPIDNDILEKKLSVYINLYNNNKLRNIEIDNKNKMLEHQSKMAVMGEMIGVISHQLKQPLNALSLHCCDIKLKYDFESLTKEDMHEFRDGTSNQINFLSNTIDGFQNFFSKNKYKSNINFIETIEKTSNLIGNQIKLSNIDFNYKEADICFNTVETEIQQVLINLIKNSIDAFKENDIDQNNRKIIIKRGKENKKIILTFEDNAGGVGEEKLEKLFEPYFTTKEDGNGIGLYMVRLVIQNSLNGDIKIENKHNGLKYTMILNED